MTEITTSEGQTLEPPKTHFDAEQRIHDQIYGEGGKSLVSILADREGGLYRGVPLITSIQIKEGEVIVEKKLHDILPDRLKAAYDNDGYLVDPDDPFWSKTSCHQTSALVGIPSIGEAEIRKYDENRKGTTGLIKENTREIGPEDAHPDDIIVLRNSLGGMVHTCNLVATSATGEIVVLSKDGKGPTVPIRLRNLSDVASEYRSHNPGLITEYRTSRPHLI